MNDNKFDSFAKE